MIWCANVHAGLHPCINSAISYDTTISINADHFQSLPITVNIKVEQLELPQCRWKERERRCFTTVTLPICALKPSPKSRRQPKWRPGHQTQSSGQGSRLETNLGCLLIVGLAGVAGNIQGSKAKCSVRFYFRRQCSLFSGTGTWSLDGY